MSEWIRRCLKCKRPWRDIGARMRDACPFCGSTEVNHPDPEVVAEDR